MFAAVTYHVLGETLAEGGKVSLLDEVAQGKGILVSVTTGKALVCHVEEWVVVTLLDSVTDGTPLLLGRVNTSWVVCASVQQDDAVLGHVLDVLDHTIKVKTNGVLVVVPVLLHLQSRVLEDGVVVCPTGSRNVDGLRAGVVSFKESTTYPQGTSTGDGLSDGDSALLDGSRVSTVSEEGGGLGEVWNTSDASVFLVEVLLNDLLLSSLDRREDVRLSLVIAVCTDT